MMATYIVGTLVAVLFILALRSIFRQRKNGGCSCGCAGCSNATKCKGTCSIYNGAKKIEDNTNISKR